MTIYSFQAAAAGEVFPVLGIWESYTARLMIMGISFKFAFPTDLTQSLKRLAHYLASMAGAGFGSASIRSFS